MSSSVGHNSMVMAVGTAASRVTGQIRTILLAAALGTTGLAANAYQAGSTIPQVIFTLVSGGIFNAVLVPQIVRTLKAKDAEDRLNKLITFAIVLLAGVTALVAALTPLLVRLYVHAGPDMLALSTSFTFWCVPQIFFYGLYTVIGQILAAKDHFGTYAWSSVGANVISCIGFTVFIFVFGRSSHQPLGYWTAGKMALTAGTWTLGVAFQALILFVPLFRIGIHYRPSWGIRGIGLRSMGSVAAWSLGIVVAGQISNIVNTRVLTSIPGKAAAAQHLSQFDVAGNASYQNAYTIYILPYSLIAVSVATAVFPKIAQAIADRNIDAARGDLSESLRNVWLMMCFFTVAFVVMPTPIALALLPSVSVKEAVLMAAPMSLLSLSLPISSAYLLIQRTFYGFEDGYHPFLFVVIQNVIQIGILLVGCLFISPSNWASLLAFSSAAGYILSFPTLLVMIRKRFDGNIDGKRITATYTKGIIATLIAIAGGLLLRYPVYALFHSDIEPGSGVRGGHMNWFQAVGVCCVLAIVIILLYVGTLWVLRTHELMPIARSLAGKFGIKLPGGADARGRVNDNGNGNGNDNGSGSTANDSNDNGGTNTSGNANRNVSDNGNRNASGNGTTRSVRSSAHTADGFSQIINGTQSDAGPANLTSSDAGSADLTSSDATSANLTSSDATSANLTPAERNFARTEEIEDAGIPGNFGVPDEPDVPQTDETNDSDNPDNSDDSDNSDNSNNSNNSDLSQTNNANNWGTNQTGKPEMLQETRINDSPVAPRGATVGGMPTTNVDSPDTEKKGF
ncbi:murein biosynthesis integral membrane protein MurJ [Bifidobacterium sp. ESL0728]|uniref:murein biosynthesis integral membrane protein MurJ n=1 Tax=Bifidobacterium sp. ESL0728 TaxID=2983220 RepID=UPI0023F7F79A|nr:murein biosynthesis integral membrane protein MurJ [Bifidobacterium sp. ESL0728]WEV59068.1 murein biosynthesis integral membrane protein MurJ [Bifidobacterium sp. ESL0728]